MLTNAEEEPSSFDAVIMYIVRPLSSTGVPVISPVVLSKTRPAESSGVIAHSKTFPPVEIGVMLNTLELLSNSTSLGAYSKTGTLSRTVMLRYATIVPPEFVPVITNMVLVMISVGVPVMSPDAVSNARPVGRLGLIAQESTSPEPLTVGERGRSLLAVLFVSTRSSGE